MKILLRPKSKIYKEKIPKCLEFGYEFKASYKKHQNGGGHIKKIFYNKNISSFVSYSEKQLHVWKDDDGEQVNSIKFFDETQSHQISCIVYTSTHMLYLAISTDFKLYIFNELLLLIGWIPINMRLVHLAHFHEEKSTLITGGIDGCFMFKFSTKSKYEPKQGIMMDPEGQFFEAELGPRMEVQNSPLWIKGLKISVKQNMMYIWSQMKVCINQIDGKILNKYKKLTSYGNHITDIFVSQKYNYFVCSTFTGQIIIFKLNQSIVIQSTDKYDPRLIGTIFPPPTAQEVLFCGYCMNIEQIFVILVNGTICIYRLDESETVLLQSKLKYTQIKDSLGRCINQNITAVTFSQIIPPLYDVEISTENAKINQDEMYRQEYQKYPPNKIDRFLVLGLSKGSVIFVPVDRIENIYSRFFFHKQAIVHLQELPKSQKFITVCQEMNIVLWGFKGNSSYQLSQYQMHRPLGQIICVDDNILMSFESGDVQLFKFDEEVQDLVYIKTEPSFEHEKKVQDFDFLQSQGLFISGSLDCYAKIWNVRKELIREIKFPEPVYCVSFLNENGDLLIGHQGKVSMVSREDYVPDEIK